MIFGQGTFPDAMTGHHGTIMLFFWFSWGCILAAILYAMRPWLQKQAHGSQELQHTRTLLNLYSQNPCSYLALEDDKSPYFGHSVDGVLPYGTIGDTIIVNGDPICKDEDFPAFLAEFKSFCQNTAHNVFFLGLTDYYLSEYEKQGFGLVKSGEEARFKLSEYEITGKNGHHFQEISDQHPCSSCLSGSDGHGSVYTANCSGQRFFGCTGLLQCFLQLLWRNTSQIPKKQ